MFTWLIKWKHRKQGSSLVFVLLLLALFAVMGGAMVTVLTSSQRSDTVQQTQRQAYFAARSAARAMAAYIEKDTTGWVGTYVKADGSAVSGTVSGVNPGTNAGNSAQVTVSYGKKSDNTVNLQQLVITGTAVFQGQNGKAVVTLTAGGGNNSNSSNGNNGGSSGSSSGTSSGGSNSSNGVFDNLFSVIGYNSSQNSWGAFNFDGLGTHPQLLVRGGLTVSQGSTTSGAILSDGDINMSGGSNSAVMLKTPKKITLSGGASFSGDVYAGSSFENNWGTVTGNVRTNGDVDFSGILNGNMYTCGLLDMEGGTISKDVFADGDLIMPQGQIQGNVTAGGKATFSGGGSKILGNLVLGETWSFANASSMGAFVNGTYLDNQTVAPLASVDCTVSIPTYSAASIPNANSLPPLIKTDNSSSSLFAPGNRVISKDGVLSGNINPGNNGYGHATVKITANDPSKEIHLYIKDNVTLGNLTLWIDKSQTRNVIIYLLDGGSLTVGDNVNFGNANYANNPQQSVSDTSVPNVYIIGNGPQVLNMVSNSTLHAYVYLPNGEANFSGSPQENNNYKLIGAGVVGNISINSNLHYLYIPLPSGTTLPAGLGGSTSSNTSSNSTTSTTSSGSSSTTWTVSQWGS
ncbi:MAG: hypothetical protein ABF904_12575 [Ethanoligenens sp.]